MDVESTTEIAEQPGASTYLISEAFAKFLGIEVREMTVLEACDQVREYIVANHLEVSCEPTLFCLFFFHKF